MKNILFFLCFAALPYFSFAQWEPDVRLTFDPAKSQVYSSSSRCIAANGDAVHITWYDERDGHRQIYYKRSLDGGSTWGTDARLTVTSAEAWLPAIAVNGDHVYIIWEDYRDGNYGEIYFKSSSDGGDTWCPDVRLTNDPAGSIMPSLSVSDSVIHVTWQEERDNNGGEIYYKRSGDGGITWEPDVCLTVDPGYSGSPSIAVTGSNVHIVWEDDRDGDFGAIYYKRSTDGGSTWGSDTPLTTSANDFWDKSIAVVDSAVHVVFCDSYSILEVYYRRSTDNGITWEEIKKLTTATGISRYASIAAGDSLVHIVWEDSRDGNFEIYYKRSIDKGITWEPDVRLTNAIYNSLMPCVALADSVVHIGWYDKRDFNDEIYYKRDPTGNVVIATGSAGENISQTPFYIFPNPANELLNIRFRTSEHTDIGIRIINMSGQTVMKWDLVTINRLTEFLMDISDISEGLYFLEVKLGLKKYFTKVVIIR